MAINFAINVAALGHSIFLKIGLEHVQPSLKSAQRGNVVGRNKSLTFAVDIYHAIQVY